jgi:hypothetical protein
MHGSHRTEGEGKLILLVDWRSAPLLLCISKYTVGGAFFSKKDDKAKKPTNLLEALSTVFSFGTNG